MKTFKSLKEGDFVYVYWGKVNMISKYFVSNINNDYITIKDVKYKYTSTWLITNDHKIQISPTTFLISDLKEFLINLFNNENL